MFRLKAVHLPPEGVALDRDIHQSQRLDRIVRLFCLASIIIPAQVPKIGKPSFAHAL